MQSFLARQGAYTAEDFERIHCRVFREPTSREDNPFQSREDPGDSNGSYSTDQIGARSHQEHVLIVGAMEARDAGLAETALNTHILHARDEVLNILASR